MGLEAALAPSPRAAMTRQKRSGRSSVEPASMTSAHATKTWLRVSWSAVARSPRARTKRSQMGDGHAVRLRGGGGRVGVEAREG